MDIITSPLFLLPFSVAAIFRAAITGLLFSLLILVSRWVAKKFPSSYSNVLLVALVLSSFLIGTYMASQVFSGMWVAIAFDGYTDKGENLFKEYWSKFFVYPFIQKSCYSQDIQECQSWAKFLGSYQWTKITSLERFWAYSTALIFGFISSGISLLIPGFVNLLIKESISTQETT